MPEVPSNNPLDLDDGPDDFQIKGAATRRQQQRKQRHRDPCIICLNEITERTVAVPCNHLAFDFLCLASWLQESPSCPLCKGEITELQYDFRSPHDFKSYRVEKPSKGKQVSNTNPARDQRSSLPIVIDDPSLERRKRVYQDQLYSLHVGTNPRSGYEEFIPGVFAQSIEQQSRCRAFLRRELQVFSFLNRNSSPRGGSQAYLIEYIVAVLKTNDPKDANGHAANLIADFIGRENAMLLLHELVAWLRSPYTRLSEWDDQAQYIDSGAEEKHD